jgi:hypothetical protein
MMSLAQRVSLSIESAGGMYKAVTVDVGVDDGLLASIQQFDARMKQLGIPHEFSMRAGNHGSHVVSQWKNKILPYFAQYLSFEQSRSTQR